jgi:hypothetical protein
VATLAISARVGGSGLTGVEENGEFLAGQGHHFLDAVRVVETGRVGVSPICDRLDQTGRALPYAQVAAQPLPPGSTALRQLDDTPLTELAMNNLDTTQPAVHRIPGGVFSLPEDDRTTLLATARAWLEASGSAAETGRALYCRQNTVRYRMHRLEEFLGGPLDNPRIIAAPSMALDAVGTSPTLLRHPQTLPRPALLARTLRSDSITLSK